MTDDRNQSGENRPSQNYIRAVPGKSPLQFGAVPPSRPANSVRQEKPNSKPPKKKG